MSSSGDRNSKIDENTGVSGIPHEVYTSQTEDKNEKHDEKKCNNYTQAGHPSTQRKFNTLQQQAGYARITSHLGAVM